MLSGMRNNVPGLMCKRNGLSTVEGRGWTIFAKNKKRELRNVRSALEPAELNRAFRVTMSALQEELRCDDSGLASKLEGPLRIIVNSLALTA